MSDSGNRGSRWRRIVGTILFDASLAVAALGIMREVIGIKINFGPAPVWDYVGPWSLFLIAAGLFVAAASIRPSRVAGTRPNDDSSGVKDRSPEIDALGPGPADIGSTRPDSTRVYRQRTE